MTQPSPDPNELSPLEIKIAVFKDWLRKKAGPLLAHSNGQVFPGWEKRLSSLLDDVRKKPIVPIALVGSTGSGKSTLLNALLGAEVLPVSNMKPCTAVVTIAHGGRAFKVKLPLVGAFQVQNAAVAAGLAIATGAEPARVFAALDHLTGAKGRLELAGTKNGAPIFIDYAHKPDALAKALGALRPYASGKLVVVFGAGGDRDAGKREIMGRIAVENADRVIVTDDNPRSEQPAAIRAAILAAAPGATEIGDRAEAIRASIAALTAGDVLLIAGKGHETGQIIGGHTIPFSDHDAVAAALQGKVA